MRVREEEIVVHKWKRTGEGEGERGRELKRSTGREKKNVKRGQKGR